MSRNVNLVFVAVSLFLVFAVFFSYDNASNSDSNVISGFVVHPLYTGYALPYSYSASSVNTFLQFSSTMANISRSFDASDSIVYRRAFVSYDGQQWTPFILTTTNTVSGDWIYTKGTASVSFTPAQLRMNLNRNVSNNTYVAIYSCSRINNAWDCHNGWQIIKFDAKITTTSTPITPPISSTGKIFYLSPKGNDNNLGTFDSPWFTLERAWENIQPGDTVYLRNGTYKYTSSQNLDGKNGAAGNLINIFAYPGETPVITRTDSWDPSPNQAGIWFEGNYFHWKGIEITGFTQDDSVRYMWYSFTAEYANHNIFELFNIHHNGLGFAIGHESTDNLILNCDFHHNYDPITGPDPYGNSDGIGFITDLGTTTIVTGCRSWANSDDGYDSYGSSGFILINNSWAWDNGYREDGVTAGGDGNGIKLGGTFDGEDYHTTHLRTVSNSLAFDNRQGGFDQNGGVFVSWIYNNVGYHNADGPAKAKYGGEVYNLNFQFAEPNPGYPTSVHVLKNNIAYANQHPTNLQANYDNCITANNTWNGGVTVTDDDFVSLDASQALRARNTDGSLPNITFLHLKQGSDLIDKGVNIGLPYSGRYPDLGAFEYP